MLAGERLLAAEVVGPEAATRRLAIAALAETSADDDGSSARTSAGPLVADDDPARHLDSGGTDAGAALDLDLLLAPPSVLPFTPPPFPDLGDQGSTDAPRHGDNGGGGGSRRSGRSVPRRAHRRTDDAAPDQRERGRPPLAQLSAAVRGDPVAFAGVAIVVLVATALLAAAGRAGSSGGAPTAAGARTVAASTTAPPGKATMPPAAGGGATAPSTTARPPTASSTSASSPVTTAPTDPRAAVSAFLATLADNTHTTAGVDALIAALNPAVLDRYGADRCRAFLASSVDPTAAFEVVSVSAPAPYDYASDGQSTTVPDTFTVQVHHTQRGTATDQAVHVARRADGSLSWFTRCKTG